MSSTVILNIEMFLIFEDMKTAEPVATSLKTWQSKFSNVKY